MAWKPIPADEWSERADKDFWEPYGRKRAGHPKAQMVKKQLELLMRSDAEAALALATKLAFADDEPSQVRVLCLNQLAEEAEKGWKG